MERFAKAAYYLRYFGYPRALFYCHYCVDFLFHATGLFLQPLKTENVFEKISNSFYSFNLYLKIVRQFFLENLATFAFRLSKCARPFWGIIYYWVKTSRLKRANNVLKYILVNFELYVVSCDYQLGCFRV